MKLYTYNELLSLYGIHDRQVKLLSVLLDKQHWDNKSIPAFKRVTTIDN